MEESAFWSELLSFLRSKRVEMLSESPFRGTQNCTFLLRSFARAAWSRVPLWP